MTKGGKQASVPITFTRWSVWVADYEDISRLPRLNYASWPYIEAWEAIGSWKEREQSHSNVYGWARGGGKRREVIQTKRRRFDHNSRDHCLRDRSRPHFKFDVLTL